jgi:hypothetical protein
MARIEGESGKLKGVWKRFKLAAKLRYSNFFAKHQYRRFCDIRKRLRHAAAEQFVEFYKKETHDR